MPTLLCLQSKIVTAIAVFLEFPEGRTLACAIMHWKGRQRYVPATISEWSAKLIHG